MKDLAKMIGKRIEARILQGASFDVVILEVDDEEIRCHDDDGQEYQIRRDAIIMWREKPVKVVKKKVE